MSENVCDSTTASCAANEIEVNGGLEAAWLANIRSRPSVPRGNLYGDGLGALGPRAWAIQRQWTLWTARPIHPGLYRPELWGQEPERNVKSAWWPVGTDD